MFTIFFVLIVLLVASWAVWFAAELLRYLTSGEYEMDRRLQPFKR